jgi:hypothetical protein
MKRLKGTRLKGTKTRLDEWQKRPKLLQAFLDSSSRSHSSSSRSSSPLPDTDFEAPPFFEDADDAPDGAGEPCEEPEGEQWYECDEEFEDAPGDPQSRSSPDAFAAIRGAMSEEYLSTAGLVHKRLFDMTQNEAALLQTSFTNGSCQCPDQACRGSSQVCHSSGFTVVAK